MTTGKISGTINGSKTVVFHVVLLSKSVCMGSPLKNKEKMALLRLKLTIMRTFRRKSSVWAALSLASPCMTGPAEGRV